MCATRSQRDWINEEWICTLSRTLEGGEDISMVLILLWAMASRSPARHHHLFPLILSLITGEHLNLITLRGSKVKSSRSWDSFLVGQLFP
jgi:hypothetical protein